MIEEASVQDLEIIYQLICELEQKTINKDRFVDVYLKAINHQDIYYYVYKYQQKVVGFTSLYIHHYLHHDHDTGEIVELIVLPQFRNLKIGYELIQYVEHQAQSLGLEEIELSTSTYRKKAHHFYEVNGYQMNHYNYTKKLII